MASNRNGSCSNLSRTPIIFSLNCLRHEAKLNELFTNLMHELCISNAQTHTHFIIYAHWISLHGYALVSVPRKTFCRFPIFEPSRSIRTPYPLCDKCISIEDLNDLT